MNIWYTIISFKRGDRTKLVKNNKKRNGGLHFPFIVGSKADIFARFPLPPPPARWLNKRAHLHGTSHEWSFHNGGDFGKWLGTGRVEIRAHFAFYAKSRCERFLARVQFRLSRFRPSTQLPMANEAMHVSRFEISRIKERKFLNSS